jgi:RHS repeat-associated protein
VKKHYSFGGTVVAERDASGLHYLHADHLGTTSLQTSSSGAWEGHQFRGPYGQPWLSSGALATDFRYTGQRSLESGASPLGSLYHYGARWYSPALGRFLQPDSIVPDPSNPQLWNRYAYVRGNPLRFSDPSGRNLKDVTAEQGPTILWCFCVALSEADAQAQAEAMEEDLAAFWELTTRPTRALIGAVKNLAQRVTSRAQGSPPAPTANEPPRPIYEENPKHGKAPRIEGGKWIGKAPDRNRAQEILEDAVNVDDAGREKVGVDPETGEHVVFDAENWQKGKRPVYHGHVRPWENEKGLRNGLTDKQREALIRNGKTDAKGNPIKKAATKDS